MTRKKIVGYYILFIRLCFFLNSSWLCVISFFFPLYRFFCIAVDWSLHPIAIVPFTEMVMWSSRNTRRLLKMFTIRTRMNKKTERLACCCCCVFLQHLIAFWVLPICEMLSIRCWIIPFVFFSQPQINQVEMWFSISSKTYRSEQSILFILIYHFFLLCRSVSLCLPNFLAHSFFLPFSTYSWLFSLLCVTKILGIFYDVTVCYCRSICM